MHGPSKKTASDPHNIMKLNLKRGFLSKRLYGKEKEGRDLLIYLLWERGAFKYNFANTCKFVVLARRSAP